MAVEVFHHKPGHAFTTVGGSHTPGDFIWHVPVTPQGAMNAGRCAQTGYMVSGDDLVTVDGLQFASDFAPERVDK